MSTNITQQNHELPNSTPNQPLPSQTEKKSEPVKPELQTSTILSNSIVQQKDYKSVQEMPNQTPEQIEENSVHRKLKPCNCEKR